jgi:hypothetical protein
MDAKQHFLSWQGLLFMTALIYSVNIHSAKPPAASPVTNFVWKAYWGGGDPEARCTRLKERGFNAFIVWNQDVDYLKKLAAAGKKHGIETYFTIQINCTRTNESLKQVMLPEDQSRYMVIKTSSIPSLCAMEYQWGGEPVKKGEVHTEPLLCFHRPETLEMNKAIIKKVLENIPDLTGMALDGIGYQNYHACYCNFSMKLFEKYHAAHKEMSKEEALNKFSLDTLVEFNNELVKYARSISPAIKTTGHIYPVFLPEPLYGYRLDVDYCGETAAWFFKPYWSFNKIEDYTRKIVQNQGKYFKNQQAVALLGLYSERRCNSQGFNCMKTKTRLTDEIKAIKQAGCDKIMFCCFDIEKDQQETDILAELLK